MEHRLDTHLSQEQDDIPAEIKVVQMSETITEQNYTIASLRTENAQLQRAIKELETEHIDVPKCEHDLPSGCCAICIEIRNRARSFDWNANVRAGGEYYE